MSFSYFQLCDIIQTSRFHTIKIESNGGQSLQNLKFVIFDMDGLLFDTEMISYRSISKALKDHHAIDFPMAIYKQTIGMDVAGTEDFFRTEYGNDVSFQAISDCYSQTFKEILDAEGLTIKPGAIRLLDHLDKLGLKRCIASSSSLKTIENYLNMSGLKDRFDFYLSGDEVENGKPAPDIFLEACRRAGESPADALVLEDSVNGFHAAKSAHIDCIVVPDLIEPTDEINQHAYTVVPSLEKVIQIIHK